MLFIIQSILPLQNWLSQNFSLMLRQDSNTMLKVSVLCYACLIRRFYYGYFIHTDFAKKTHRWDANTMFWWVGMTCKVMVRVEKCWFYEVRIQLQNDINPQCTLPIHPSQLIHTIRDQCKQVFFHCFISSTLWTQKHIKGCKETEKQATVKQ